MPYKVVYYKSIICPRCIPTNRLITRLKQAYPEIEVEEIEVLRHPGRARRDGIRGIPTIIVGPHRIHGPMALEDLVALAKEGDSVNHPYSA